MEIQLVTATSLTCPLGALLLAECSACFPNRVGLAKHRSWRALEWKMLRVATDVDHGGVQLDYPRKSEEFDSGLSDDYKSGLERRHQDAHIFNTETPRIAR